jgi:hypothetical protein
MPIAVAFRDQFIELLASFTSFVVVAQAAVRIIGLISKYFMEDVKKQTFNYPRNYKVKKFRNHMQSRRKY